MDIRLAQPDDLDALTEIEADADQRYADSAHPELASGSTIPREVLERAIARRWIIVASEDERVVGWVLLTRCEDELCVGQISVRRAAGGRGVGSKLLDTVVASARAAGQPSIVLNTQADVQSAVVRAAWLRRRRRGRLDARHARHRAGADGGGARLEHPGPHAPRACMT